MTPRSPEDGTRYCWNKACPLAGVKCDTTGRLLPRDPEGKLQEIPLLSPSEPDPKTEKDTSYRVRVPVTRAASDD
jgi:hypothetical protein